MNIASLKKLCSIKFIKNYMNFKCLSEKKYSYINNPKNYIDYSDIVGLLKEIKRFFF